jgi:hypothetical protein
MMMMNIMAKFGGGKVSVPLPEGWERLFTEEGDPYFLHVATNATQWERPLG